MTASEMLDRQLLCCTCEAPPTPPATDQAAVDSLASEIAQGFSALSGVTKGVSIFGSARPLPDDHWYKLAEEVAGRLGMNGFAIISGGGPGIMEAANRGAQRVGARSIGLQIELPHEQASNPFVDDLVTFRHFFVRKLMFVRYSVGFVAFPGGFGTLDELFEVLTLVQTGRIRHFPLVLVGEDHWRPLLVWLRERLLGLRLVAPEDVDLVRVTEDVDEIVGLLDRCHAEHAQDCAAGHPAGPAAETLTRS